jgi:predicted nucleotidyltransferase
MDTSSLLRSLNAQHVQYVIIGATAFPSHGYARATGDIDILIKPTKENARRTLVALADVGYEITDLTTEEMLTNKILFRQYILATDVHPFATGITFATVWRHRVKDTIGGVPVSVASLDDLIKMKRAANRPKDREDLKVLRELKNRKR